MCLFTPYLRLREVDRGLEGEGGGPDRDRFVDDAREVVDRGVDVAPDERESRELRLGEDRARHVLGGAKRVPRLLERDFRFVEESAADQDLAEVCAGECRLRRVSEALELVARVRVVARSPPAIGPLRTPARRGSTAMTAADRAAPSSR